MAVVTFRIVDGVDKGRLFGGVDTPITIGREEGNTIRLNDERVSRFHVKIQEDHGQIVLTDLDSTNGTRVNGETVQLRILRAGDRVNIGRSTLVYGDIEQILEELSSSGGEEEEGSASATFNEMIGGRESQPAPPSDEDRVDVFKRPAPILPGRLSPAQAAQLSEVVDYLHRALADAIDLVHIPPRSREARLPLANWQRVQMVLAALADYSRQVGEPTDADIDGWQSEEI